MARTRSGKHCFKCQASDLFFQKREGSNSVVLHNPDGSVHTCSKLPNGTKPVESKWDSPKTEQTRTETRTEESRANAENQPKTPEMPSSDSNAGDDSENITPAGSEIYKLVRPNVIREITQRVKDFTPKSQNVIVTHDVRFAPENKEPRSISGAHKMLVELVEELMSGEHVMLVGPAGTGKTKGCEMAAKLMGREFRFISCGPQTSKSDLIGFIDAHGKYHSTGLREAVENGMVFLLDEGDAGNPGVLTALNAILDGGESVSFPDGLIHRHSDFICVMACNTFGTGASREYVGRNQLDAATLSRFTPLIWDYDFDMERMLAHGWANGDDAIVSSVCDYINTLRAKRDELKIRVVLSTRHIRRMCKQLARGKKWGDVINVCIWNGVSAEDRLKLEGKR